MKIEERIRYRAYEIWEREGHPEGRAIDHWILAQGEEAAMTANKPKKAALRMKAKLRSPRATPPAAQKTHAPEVILN